jgi:hypothetical protein
MHPDPDATSRQALLTPLQSACYAARVRLRYSGDGSARMNLAVCSLKRYTIREGSARSHGQMRAWKGSGIRTYPMILQLSSARRAASVATHRRR